jgi:hypothetical protein
MKRLVLVSLLLLNGCVVQSFGPFCSDRSLISLKEAMGQWSLQTDMGDDVSTNGIKPWVFSGSAATDCTLLAFDKENSGATFEVRFFKLGKDVFVDMYASNLGDEAKVNSYWLYAVHPCHVVCKVLLKDDKLTLRPLDFDWLKEYVGKHKGSLPYMGRLDDLPLFTASPKQWETFLSKQSKNADAFPDKNALLLKKVAVAK